MPASICLAATLLCAFAAASAVQAQQRVKPVPNSVPSSAARVAQTAPPAVTTPATGGGPLGVGAGAAYDGAGNLARGPGQTVAGAGGLNATDAARLFYFADGNHDGELTRAEFGRLGFAAMTFEEMDRNYDGVISRFEYDDSLR